MYNLQLLLAAPTLSTEHIFLDLLLHCLTYFSPPCQSP
jgi:hypothetical protein